jgi:hypothetical protein
MSDAFDHYPDADTLDDEALNDRYDQLVNDDFDELSDAGHALDSDEMNAWADKEVEYRHELNDREE